MLVLVVVLLIKGRVPYFLGVGSLLIWALSAALFNKINTANECAPLKPDAIVLYDDFFLRRTHL